MNEILTTLKEKEARFELLSDIVKRYFIKNLKGTDIYFLFCIWKEWNRLVKKNKSFSQAEPVYFQYEQLFLWVPSSVVACELNYFTMSLIEDINRYFSEKKGVKKQVKKIKFTINEELLNVRRSSFSKISCWV